MPELLARKQGWSDVVKLWESQFVQTEWPFTWHPYLAIFYFLVTEKDGQTRETTVNTTSEVCHSATPMYFLEISSITPEPCFHQSPVLDKGLLWSGTSQLETQPTEHPCPQYTLLEKASKSGRGGLVKSEDEPSFEYVCSIQSPTTYWTHYWILKTEFIKPSVDHPWSKLWISGLVQNVVIVQ